MALCFLVVNAQSDTVIYAGSGQPHWITDSLSFIAITDDAQQEVKDLINNINSHKFSEVMNGKQYVIAYYSNGSINVQLRNMISNPPTIAKVSLLGETYNINIKDAQATFPLTIHPSVIGQRISVSVTVEGFPYIYVEAGGMGGNIPVQQYTDDTGLIHIVPKTNADLAAYWQSQSFDQVWSEADIATITGLNTYVLFHYVLPALMNTSYTPLVLSQDEVSSVTDVQNNVLPNIPADLDVLAPYTPTGGTQTFDPHYSSFRTHLKEAKDAMENYISDMVMIEKYVKLS